MKSEIIKVNTELVKIANVEERESKHGGTYKLVTVVDTVDMEQHVFCDRTAGLVKYDKDDLGTFKLKIELKSWQSEGKWRQGYEINVIGFHKAET